MDWTSLLGAAASGPVGMIVGAGTRLVTAMVQMKQEEAKARERVSERAHEVEMRKLDMEAAAKASEQQLAAINAQGDVNVLTAAYKTWEPTGIKWVDAWNATMRPGSFTSLWGVWVWLHWVFRPLENAVGALVFNATFLSLVSADTAMLGAAMGFVWADRTLRKAIGR